MAEQVTITEAGRAVLSLLREGVPYSDAVDFVERFYIPLDKLGGMVQNGLYSPEATEDTEFDFQGEE